MKLKSIGYVLMAASAVFAAGCIVTSVQPFYTDKDLVFEPALVGAWSKVQQADEHWKFEPEGTNAYRLTYSTEPGKSSLMRAHLFKLNGQLFFDLFAANVESDVMPPPIPSHLLLRVFQTAPTARMAAMSYEWLAQILEKDPSVLRHHVIKTGDKAEDRRIVITASTQELQQFILQHLDTKEAWQDDFELKRDAAGQ